MVHTVRKRRHSKYPRWMLYVFGALRRVFGWSEQKREALMRARKQPGQYECSGCQGLYTQAHVHVDHIVPVMPTDGFDDWNNFMSRLFCDPNGLQVVCKSCHKAKTKSENALRRRGTKNVKS